LSDRLESSFRRYFAAGTVAAAVATTWTFIVNAGTVWNFAMDNWTWKHKRLRLAEEPRPVPMHAETRTDRRRRIA
jgi:hypothetical protein